MDIYIFKEFELSSPSKKKPLISTDALRYSFELIPNSSVQFTINFEIFSENHSDFENIILGLTQLIDITKDLNHIISFIELD